MRLLKILLGLFIVLALAMFLSSNSDQYNDIWLYPGRMLMDVNLAYTMVSALAIGLILGFLIGLIQIVSQQNEIRGINRQLKKLRTELNNLRHSSIEDSIFEDDDGELSEMDKTPTLEAEKPVRLEQ